MEYEWNEIIKTWLQEMYERAIEDTQGAIGNEEIWAEGSDDVETANMHRENIEMLQYYIGYLEDLIVELRE